LTLKYIKILYLKVKGALSPDWALKKAHATKTP